MGKRAVYVQKCWVDNQAGLLLNCYHWLVMVEDDVYEIERGREGKSMRINNRLDGKAKRSWPHGPFRNVTRNLSGTTTKSDEEIARFNCQWMKDFPHYNALEDNCQKFALDLVQFLIGGSFTLPLPQAGKGAWADGPSSHCIDNGKYAHAKATFGKAGAQFGIFAVEAEAPMASAMASSDFGFGTQGAFAEASLGRVEGKVGPVRARIEPNVNTGGGFRDGQLEVKLLGFGFSVGGKGLAVHTALGSAGLGQM